MVRVGTDRSVYVLDDGRVEILVFDQGGEFVRRIGRTGEGPGEFVTLARLGFKADTLWVLDWLRQTTHFFRTDGRVIGARRLAIDLDSTRYTRPTLPTALLVSGRMVIEGEPKSTEPPDAVGAIMLTNVDLGLDTLLLRELWRGRVPIPGLGALRVSAIEDHSLFDVDAHGRRIVAVDRSPQAFSADEPTAELALTTWNAAGVSTASRRLPGFRWPPVTPTERDVTHRRAMEALNRTLAQLPELRKQIPNPDAVVRDVLLLPEAHPPVDDLRAASDGTMWLRLSVPDSARTWLVLDADAEPQFFVRFPADFAFHDSMGAQIWGVATDSLDVQYLVRLDIPDLRR